MSDLIRRQSAINAIENTDVPMSAKEWDELTDAIVSIPAVDAVEVVRCRECKYCHIEDEYEAWCHGGLPAVMTRATEDFCSHGKRREEEHNAVD